MRSNYVATFESILRRGAQLVTAVVISAALAGPVPATPVSAETMVQSTTLPSGLTVVTEQRPESRVAGVSVAVRAGSRNEDESTDSAVKMLERMYVQGTITRPSRDELLRPVTRLGGDMSVGAGWESLVFQTSVRSSDFDVALDVLSDALLHSTFDPVKFEKERDLALQEFSELQDQPPSLAAYTLQRQIFAGQSLGHVPGGTPEGLQRLTPEALNRFRNTWVTADRTVAAVVSPFPHDAVVAQVAAALKELTPAASPPPTVAATDLSRASVGRVDLTAGSDQAIVLIGTAIPGASDPDRAAITVAVSALNGFTGRLMHEIRDLRGLAYGTSAGNRLTSDAGLFLVQAATEPGNSEAVLGLLEEQLGALADSPPAEDELQRAIGQAVGQRLLSNEAALSRAADLAGSWVVGSRETLEETEARLRAVTVADIQRISRKYFTSDRLLRLVVQP